ncbi:helix-turn-helix domain-containing protein [Heliorestis convoluta]|uniref:Putative XRE family transcriptional regulator n=1 Tax=Heliorestis convoluta TaxID=356322 RepID=A0A5Q2MXR8_9FIRM|nr:helix-turn-helix transcriptional regulator [Heliorestis convoluta]QGG47377.1 putative XRE family transcriptional regulator [Heliorestis convoluta]
MNSVLGARIRSLRESKGLTQEQVAERMNCTRQKYARIEKGLVDISYASIITIAQILEVSPDQITSAVNNEAQKEPMFRDNGASEKGDKFQFLDEMIDTFYAHRKLYKSVRQVDGDE